MAKTWLEMSADEPVTNTPLLEYLWGRLNYYDKEHEKLSEINIPSLKSALSYAYTGIRQEIIDTIKWVESK